jgi:uncharacterized protein (DUF2267 family)
MSDVAILDTSVQRTHEWLHEIGRELGFENERGAYAALRARLHGLRDRLPVEPEALETVVDLDPCWFASHLAKVPA